MSEKSSNFAADLKNTYMLEEFRNKIINGDCLEVLHQLPANSIDLVVTSPPYNLKNSTGNGMKDALIDF